MKKQIAPVELPMTEVLAGVQSGVFLASYRENAFHHGFEHVAAGLSTVSSIKGVNTKMRHYLQESVIPENQKGNLRKFAGKRVQIICTTITIDGGQINMFVKEITNA